MSNELLVTNLLMERDYYYKYSRFVLGLKNLEPEHERLLLCLGDYFETYPKQKACSVAEYEVFFNQQYPSLKNPKLTEDMFKSLQAAGSVNPDLITDLLTSMIARYHGASMLEQLVDLEASGKTSVLDVDLPGKLSEYDTLIKELKKTEDPFVDRGLRDLFEAEKLTPGLSWRLSELTEVLGELRGGVHGFVFARSDSGKSTFGLSEAAHQATQLEEGECILYLGNEEKIDRLQYRAYSSLLNISKQALERIYDDDPARLDKATALFKARGGHRLLIAEGYSILQIEAMIARYKPRCVWIDAGPKVQLPGTKNLGEQDRLSALFGAFRAIGNRYDIPIISLGQAGAQADSKKWLSQVDVFNSSTNIQAECDFMIGIGRTYEPSEVNLRFLNIVKTKLKYGRTAKITAKYEPEVCRFLDR